MHRGRIGICGTSRRFAPPPAIAHAPRLRHLASGRSRPSHRVSKIPLRSSRPRAGACRCEEDCAADPADEQAALSSVPQRSSHADAEPNTCILKWSARSIEIMFPGRLCICCGAPRQSEYRSLPYCSRCLSGECLRCQRRIENSESGRLRVCMCCGEDRWSEPQN